MNITLISPKAAVQTNYDANKKLIDIFPKCFIRFYHIPGIFGTTAELAMSTLAVFDWWIKNVLISVLLMLNDDKLKESDINI